MKNSYTDISDWINACTKQTYYNNSCET